MLYSIMQLTAEPPSAERLIQAFGTISGLTRSDAMTLARNAIGILAEGLNLEQAQTIQEALGAQGVAVAAVDGTEAPVLPAPMKLRRADCALEILTVYDVLGRPRQVEWSRVVVLAAGQVNQSEFKRVATEEREYEYDEGGPSTLPVSVTRYTTREERGYPPVVEIILDEPAVRYHIEAAKFIYDYLKGRLSSISRHGQPTRIKWLRWMRPSGRRRRRWLWLRRLNG